MIKKQTKNYFVFHVFSLNVNPYHAGKLGFKSLPLALFFILECIHSDALNKKYIPYLDLTFYNISMERYHITCDVSG
jgi:hypothetical protein